MKLAAIMLVHQKNQNKTNREANIAAKTVDLCLGFFFFLLQFNILANTFHYSTHYLQVLKSRERKLLTVKTKTATQQ